MAQLKNEIWIERDRSKTKKSNFGDRVGAISQIENNISFTSDDLYSLFLISEESRCWKTHINILQIDGIVLVCQNSIMEL